MSTFDLNLVRTFVLLYETGSVSLTAQELHVTQPTVSYSLGKLRRRFGDDLFQRSGRGLVATATAHRLYEPLRRALARIDDTIQLRDRFDPATMRARFTLAMSDLGETLLLPRLVAAARRDAPSVSFIVRPLDVQDAEQQLGRGEIDAFVATPALRGQQIARIPLFREEYVGLVSTDHPRLRSGTVTMSQLAAEQHVTVFGPSGHLDPRSALEQHGLLDRVAVELTRFSTLPYLLQETDLFAMVPEFVAEQFARSHPVKPLQLPLQLGTIEVAAYARHPSSRGPAQRWLVDFLVEVLGEHVSPVPPTDDKPEPR